MFQPPQPPHVQRTFQWAATVPGPMAEQRPWHRGAAAPGVLGSEPRLARGVRFVTTLALVIHEDGRLGMREMVLLNVDILGWNIGGT